MEELLNEQKQVVDDDPSCVVRFHLHLISMSSFDLILMDSWPTCSI